MKFNNDNRRAIIGTTITHVIVLLLLILLAFKTPLPLPEELGVEVIFEGGGGGGGFDSPVTSETVSDITDEMIQPSDYTEKVVKQTTDPSVNLSLKTQPQEVDAKKPEVDQRVTDFWKNRTKNHSDGTGRGTGSGTSTGTGNDSGIGTGTSDGAGPSFNLYGRYRKSLLMPDYTEKEQGRVVVEIWVDRDGNVTRAMYKAKGSTTANSSLIQKAQGAALNSKFSSNPNAPEEQKGTITYNFIKLK